MKQPHNIEWMDTLRAIATLSVIVVHTSTPVVKMIYGRNMEFWWIGNIIDSSVRFCVPIFLMISGALLLNKEDTLSEFYKKRFMRVLIPFLFWFVVYLAYSWLIEKPNKQPHGLEAVINWVGNLFIEKGISVHFWFVYMLLVLYAFAPFLGRWMRKLQNTTILYILVAWVILNLVHMTKIIHTEILPLWLNKAYLYFRYAGYMLLGYYLLEKDFSSIKSKIIGWILFIGSIVITAGATYYFSRQSDKLDLSYYGYLPLNSIMQSIGIFILIKDSTIKNKTLAWIRNTISEYSYGIYLVHIIVIGVFFLNGIFWTMSHPLISLPIMLIATLIVSTAIIYMLRKIPFGNYISG